jgi:hypothetical protein
MIKFTKSLDMKGAVIYINGMRAELDASQVEELYRQLDAIRRSLGIAEQQRKSKLEDWFEVSRC